MEAVKIVTQLRKIIKRNQGTRKYKDVPIKISSIAEIKSNLEAMTRGPNDREE